MVFYEFIFIAQQSLLEQEVNGLIQEFSVILSKVGATLVKHEGWGLLELAYSIKKCNKGHYCLLYIEALPEAMDEFRRKVRLKEEVIRSMCLQIEQIPAESSVMVKSDSE